MKPRPFAALAALVAAGAVTVLVLVSDDDPIRRVTDQTGRLTLTVPSGWDDVDTEPLRIQGRSAPYVQAAPDLSAGFDRLDAPRAELLVVAAPEGVTLDRLLRESAGRLGASKGCDSEEADAFLLDDLPARRLRFEGCGDTDAELWLVAATTGGDVAILGIQGASAEERKTILEGISLGGADEGGGDVPAPG